MASASKWTTAVGAAYAAALACVAAAQAMVVDSESARGHAAYASAAGLAFDPSSIWVRVAANPRQRVSGTWTMVCSAGFGSASSGRFAGRAPLQRKLLMPQSFPPPAYCTVLASAQLAHRGHISVTVLSYSQPAPVRHGP